MKVVEANDKRPLRRAECQPKRGKTSCQGEGDVQRTRVREASTGCSPGVLEVVESLLVAVLGVHDEDLVGWVGNYEGKEERGKGRVEEYK